MSQDTQTPNNAPVRDDQAQLRQLVEAAGLNANDPRIMAMAHMSLEEVAQMDIPQLNEAVRKYQPDTSAGEAVMAEIDKVGSNYKARRDDFKNRAETVQLEYIKKRGKASLISGILGLIAGGVGTYFGLKAWKGVDADKKINMKGWKKNSLIAGGGILGGGIASYIADLLTKNTMKDERETLEKEEAALDKEAETLKVEFTQKEDAAKEAVRYNLVQEILKEKWTAQQKLDKASREQHAPTHQAEGNHHGNHAPAEAQPTMQPKAAATYTESHQPRNPAERVTPPAGTHIETQNQRAPAEFAQGM